MTNRLVKGKYYTHKNYGGIWTMVSCDWNQLRLINLENGSRWGDKINPKEWKEIFVKFEVVS